MLLLQQDEISVLEKNLEALDRRDRDERHEIFLGSCREDKNLQRKKIIETLHVALAKYGKEEKRTMWFEPRLIEREKTYIPTRYYDRK